MVNWLAEFLGVYVIYGFGYQLPGEPGTETYDGFKEWLETPNAFFAVWNAAEEKGLPIVYIFKDLFLPKYVTGKKENRYKAFYNAVYLVGIGGNRLPHYP